MTKRSAEIFAEHESVPAGAVPFFAPCAKRSRSRGDCALPPSPSDLLALHCHGFPLSSDEMSDVNDVCSMDQADAVSAHHLAAAGSWAGAHGPLMQSQQHLSLLGILSPPACPDARQFLEQLSGCMYAGHSAGSSSGAANSSLAASIGSSMWHAFAEFNVLLSRHFSELPTAMLRGYHSFTRAPRAQLWARLAASQGAQLCEAAPHGWPCHMLLTRFLLEHVLAAHPTASCVLYTIELPPWLRSWCARWGRHQHHQHHDQHLHPPGVMRVLALFAFEGGNSAGAGAGSPPRVLYVPFAE